MKKLKITLLFTFIFSFLFTAITVAQKDYKPIVKKSIFFGKSKPIREMNIVVPGEHPEDQRAIKNFFLTNKDFELPKKEVGIKKPVLQNQQGPKRGRGPILNFEGIENVNGYYPADPNGDVSENYYMQSVNSSFAVWDKSANLVYGPVDNKSLWSSLPGPWHSIYWSDPVFKYDYLADRWVISSMSFNFDQELYYEMVAVSETNDPLGSYNCYVFQFLYVNDYPKLSVWNDGYYITYNLYEYTDNWYFEHSIATVVDRDAMIAGEEEITMIQFEFPHSDLDRFFPIASDLRGSNVPDESPCYVVIIESPDTLQPWFLSLDVYEFATDWNEPTNSSFTKVSQFDIGEVEPIINPGPGAPQPINQKNVSTIPLFMMYPVTYRMFDAYESMVCSATMWDGEIHYVKWYELRKEDENWYVYQEGNYSPDNSHRYQPSISINGKGDIAMGFTVSDEETFPSIRMTGRHANDPLGEMSYEEIELFAGLNYINTYQENFDQNRWGDYASMVVDPVNDTTFWFTNMYPKSQTNLGNWGTRIFAIDLNEEFEEVTANAGNDTLICYNDYVFTTDGEASNYNAIEWNSSGDGTFLFNSSLNSKYIKGQQDISNGQVQLILHASGYEPGSEAIDTMTLVIDPCTGIEELAQQELQLSISPNPTAGIVTVQTNTGINKNVNLQLFDAQGKQLFTEETITKTDNYTRTLDFSFKEDGMYYIRLYFDEQVATGKIVLMK